LPSAVNGHFAGETGELAGAGVGYDCNAELRGSSRHGAGVLEDKGAGAAVEGAGDDLNGDIAGGAFDGGAGGEHGAFAGGFEVAVELFVEEEAAQGFASGVGVGGLWGGLHFKRSTGVILHFGSFEIALEVVEVESNRWFCG
jgi:hypothetical protein